MCVCVREREREIEREREREGQMRPLKSINRGKTITTSAGKYRFDELEIREDLEFLCKYVNI